MTEHRIPGVHRTVVDSSRRQLEPVQLPEPAAWVRRWTWRLVGAAAVMGAAGALAAVVVRLGFRGLQWMLTGSGASPPLAANHLGLLRRALTPVAGAALASFVVLASEWWARRRGQERKPHVEYVEAVRHGGGRIPMAPNAWRTGEAAFSVASGAAVGREGSMIQFAAAVASGVGRWRGWLVASREDSPAAERSFLVACGVAGGVTTAYNAPLAAMFFAAEIVLGGISREELPLLGLAAGVGWIVSGTTLGWARLYPTHVTLGWGRELWLLPLLAVVCAVAGPAYQWLLGSLRRLERLPGALLWGGAVVGCLSMLEPRVWGNGDAGLSAALGKADLPGIGLGPAMLGRVLGLRLLATLSCVWTGTVGGVFTPTLFAGGAMGALLGHWALGGQASGPGVLWAIAGMSFFMAAVTHAPLMAAFMAVELTGDWALLPVLLPLNFLARHLARAISARAMYSIASQTPQAGPPERGREPGKVE